MKPSPERETMILDAIHELGREYYLYAQNSYCDTVADSSPEYGKK